MVEPFIEQLQSDLIYRQRRHAETTGTWSTLAKVLASVTAVLVCMAAIASVVIQLIILHHGGAVHGH